MHPAVTQARWAGTWFTYPGLPREMLGWVDLVFGYTVNTEMVYLFTESPVQVVTMSGIIIIIIINEKINVAYSPKTSRTCNKQKKRKQQRVR